MTVLRCLVWWSLIVALPTGSQSRPLYYSSDLMVTLNSNNNVTIYGLWALKPISMFSGHVVMAPQLAQCQVPVTPSAPKPWIFVAPWPSASAPCTLAQQVLLAQSAGAVAMITSTPYDILFVDAFTNDTSMLTIPCVSVSSSSMALLKDNTRLASVSDSSDGLSLSMTFAITLTIAAAAILLMYLLGRYMETICVFLHNVCNPHHRAQNRQITPLTENEADRCHVNKLTSTITDKECAICLQALEENQWVAVTPCNHTYHVNCLSTWVFEQLLCPLCKRPILPFFALDDLLMLMK